MPQQGRISDEHNAVSTKHGNKNKTKQNTNLTFKAYGYVQVNRLIHIKALH